MVNGSVVSATGVRGVRYRRQIELSTALSPSEKTAAFDALPTPGFSAVACGESTTPQVHGGDTLQIGGCFMNTGTVAWVKGSSTQVDLAMCCPPNVAGLEADWVVSPLTPIEYATTLVTTVSPGQSAVFTFAIHVPPGTAPGDYVFEGNLVVASSGAPLKGASFRQSVHVLP